MIIWKHLECGRTRLRTHQARRPSSGPSLLPAPQRRGSAQRPAALPLVPEPLAAFPDRRNIWKQAHARMQSARVDTQQENEEDLLRDFFSWNFSLPLFCFLIVTPSVHRGNKRAANMSGVGALLLAAFLLCSPVAGRARPADARTRRSVTHAQLMHDKGRTLQDFKRRLWLQELLDEVHTAEIRQLPLSKAPPAPSKGLAADWSPEEREATNLPQETHKSFRDAKRRKKGRPGRRKDADKRKRRAQAKPL
ncbi:parathyroid hormone-like hormone a [Syngnathus typhle]|uniref:parathyroid hormone-like hormone a n=1 Tax=Syngnathus typhle TaxID=161592 RepID=UPI002A6B36B3|nr:parathyroid hormone-like hormone a [Syngnathus typhle]XP_061124627.1 parathyroid hormone-like hormone a [Syngnathus typhle]XP_061124628.1 parathyroid hormone-like hormone a [Syngnathus typhle]